MRLHCIILNVKVKLTIILKKKKTLVSSLNVYL